MLSVWPWKGKKNMNQKQVSGVCGNMDSYFLTFIMHWTSFFLILISWKTVLSNSIECCFFLIFTHITSMFPYRFYKMSKITFLSKWKKKEKKVLSCRTIMITTSKSQDKSLSLCRLLRTVTLIQKHQSCYFYSCFDAPFNHYCVSSFLLSHQQPVPKTKNRWDCINKIMWLSLVSCSKDSGRTGLCLTGCRVVSGSSGGERSHSFIIFHIPENICKENEKCCYIFEFYIFQTNAA